MKKLILVALSVFLFSSISFAQVINRSWDLKPVTVSTACSDDATKACSPVENIANRGLSAHIFTWSVQSGIFSSCNLLFQTSPDNKPTSTWTTQYTGDCTSGGTSNYLIFTANFIRVKASPYTVVSGNALVTVNYAGYVIAPTSIATLTTAPVNNSNINNKRYCNSFSGATASIKIQACIDDLPSTGGTADATGIEGTQSGTTITISKSNVTLLLGATTLTLTGAPAINVSGNHVCIKGIGEQASILKYNPSGTGTLINWNSGVGSAIVQGCITGIGLDATGNTSQVKTGIQVTDAEELELSNISISNWHDTTNASTGIGINGRQTFDVHNIINFSDIPFHIGVDPNTMIVALDHAHFYNIYACNCVNGSAVSTNPIWTIDSGVWLTSDTWDGYQAWVGGTYGFYYSSAGEAVTGFNNRIANCRTEQSTNAGGFGIYFAPGNAATYQTKIENCYLSAPVAMGGIFLRNQTSAKIDGNIYATTAGVALNVNSTVTFSATNNYFNFGASSTVTTTGSHPTMWCGNDKAAANTLVPNCGLGVANPTNYLVIPNNQSYAGLSTGGSEITIVKVDAANNHVELDPGAVAAYTGGTLSLAGDRSTNGNPLVVANNAWLAANDGANPKGMVKLDSSGRLTFGEDATKTLIINPSIFCFGGAAGTCVTRGTGNPNGAVTGNIGDIFLNLSGGSGTTLYIKEAGNGTNVNWVGK